MVASALVAPSPVKDIVVKKPLLAAPVKAPVLTSRRSANIVVPGGQEVGQGTPEDPLRQTLRDKPNKSNCVLCPSETCPCELFDRLLADTYDGLAMKRITSVTGKRNMCAKSILPNFVSRIVRLLQVTKADTFYDLGSGNGSVLFQVAFMTGAKCVGVELSAHNAELSRQAWADLKPKLEKVAKKKMPEVTIITGDLTQYIADPTFGTSGNTVIWASNLLLPKSVTAYMAERFRTLAPGSRLACFDDFYPHGRSIAKIRDPDAFQRFEMTDCLWPSGAVEWCMVEGPFYLHRRRDAEKKQPAPQ